MIHWNSDNFFFSTLWRNDCKKIQKIKISYFSRCLAASLTYFCNCAAVSGNSGWLVKDNLEKKIHQVFFLPLSKILISFYLIYVFISFFKAATPRNLRKYNMIIQWYCILYILPVLNSLFKCLTSYLFFFCLMSWQNFKTVVLDTSSYQKNAHKMTSPRQQEWLPCAKTIEILDLKHTATCSVIAAQSSFHTRSITAI